MHRDELGGTQRARVLRSACTLALDVLDAHQRRGTARRRAAARRRRPGRRAARSPRRTRRWRQQASAAAAARAAGAARGSGNTGRAIDFWRTNAGRGERTSSNSDSLERQGRRDLRRPDGGQDLALAVGRHHHHIPA